MEDAIGLFDEVLHAPSRFFIRGKEESQKEPA